MTSAADQHAVGSRTVALGRVAVAVPAVAEIVSNAFLAGILRRLVASEGDYVHLDDDTAAAERREHLAAVGETYRPSLQIDAQIELSEDERVTLNRLLGDH